MLCIRHLVYIINFFVYVYTDLPPLGHDEEFFTAASDMALLLKVEQTIGKGLLRYIERENKKIEDLEAEIKKIEDEHVTKMTDEEWVSQATNAYGILKRFTSFWPQFDKYAKKDKIENLRVKLKADLKSLEDSLPTENDLRGALTAITRIQDTYNITASEFIYGLGFSQPLDVQELFQMGYLWSELEDFTHAREWFLEAAKRFPKGVNMIGFLDKASLYEFVAWCEYKLNNLIDAIHYTKEVLKLSPDQASSIANLKLFSEEYNEKQREKTSNEKETETESESETLLKKQRAEDEWYYRLCRGHTTMNKSIADKLYCRYGQDSPSFILKPLKIEYAYYNPNITLFHDLLTDFQINHIKTKALPYLRRATVHNKKGRLVFADYRISKSTWMKPENDKIVADMYRKVGRVVDLDTRSFEPLQIANYGLAGQYEPHFDYHRNKKNPRYKHYGGNRLATMLLYMSDVERGGSTVFTKTGPGVVVTPRKGTGVFWFNLKRNGSGDTSTEHAACPVVLGSKWICNIWVHEYYQEYRFPCSLNRDE